MREILQSSSDHMNGQTNFIKEGEKFSTIIQRDDKQTGNFGFSIAGGDGGTNQTDNFYISKINNHEQNSSLAIGDRLLAINGHETGNITHDQALDIINNGGNNLELVLYREKYTNGHNNSIKTMNIDNTIEVNFERKKNKECLKEMRFFFLGSKNYERKWTNGFKYCWRD